MRARTRSDNDRDSEAPDVRMWSKPQATSL